MIPKDEFDRMVIAIREQGGEVPLADLQTDILPAIWEGQKKICRTPQGSVLELVQTKKRGIGFPGLVEIIEYKNGEKKSWGEYATDQAMRIAKQFCGVYPEGDFFLQTQKYWVKIKDPGATTFTKGAIISWEEFKEDDRKVRERGERPASVEIVKESTPGNGNGGKELPATIEGEPIPDKYRDLTPFIDEPLPPGTDFLVPAVVTEEGERKIDTVMRQLKDGVEGIQDSSQFRLFLTTMSKFHDYSIGNLILIAIQKPAATRVAGFQRWKDLDRWVKKGESGIAILAPVLPPKPKKEEWEVEEEEVQLQPVYFKVVHVFDVSQTEGKPLPKFDVPVLTGEANEELFADVLALVANQGLDVSFELRPNQDPALKGQLSGKLIWVKPDEARAQQLKTLLHETAHYYSEGVFRIPRRDAETIAESAAFAVGAHFGFDSGTRSFPYVALWAQDKKVLQANLASIRKVTTVMLEGLEKEQGAMAAVTKPRWKQYKEGEQRPSHPIGRPRWGYREYFDSLSLNKDNSGLIIGGPVSRSNKSLNAYLARNKPKKEKIITRFVDKKFYPEFSKFIDDCFASWQVRMKASAPKWVIGAEYDFVYDPGTTTMVVPLAMAKLFAGRLSIEGYDNLKYHVAHEFFHHVVFVNNLEFDNDLEEEDYANRMSEWLTNIKAPDAFVSLFKLLRNTWDEEFGDLTLERALEVLSVDRSPDQEWLPALKPFEPYHFAEYVLRFNRFNDAEIPIYSGLTGRNPLRVPDHIWREVIEGTEGEFVKQGELSVFHIAEKGRPEYMRAAPTWRDITSTIPTKPSTPSPREELEFVSDSPELIPFTIEEIGYRDKLDNAFQAAIARAKGK